MTEPCPIQKQLDIARRVAEGKAVLEMWIEDLKLDFRNSDEAWPGQELRYDLYLIGRLSLQLHDLLSDMRYWAEVQAGVREHVVYRPRLVIDKATDGLSLDDLDL
jgi:hypothetical protein